MQLSTTDVSIKRVYTGDKALIQCRENEVICVPIIVSTREHGKEKSTRAALAARIDGSICPIAYLWSPNRYQGTSVVQCYRAIQLFTKSTLICEDTLCACYYAMSTSQTDKDTRNRYLDVLKNDGFTDVVSAREEILKEKIPVEVLDHLLKSFIQDNIQPNLAELRAELYAGRIEKTFLVEQLISC